MEEHIVAVVQYLDAHRNDLLEFTRELIATSSINPPGNERAVAELVMRRLKELDLSDFVIKAKIPDRPNLFCRLNGSPDGPTLMLSGHLDTKPIGDRSKWKHRPLARRNYRWPVVRPGLW